MLVRSSKRLKRLTCRETHAARLQVGLIVFPFVALLRLFQPKRLTSSLSCAVASLRHPLGYTHKRRSTAASQDIEEASETSILFQVCVLSSLAPQRLVFRPFASWSTGSRDFSESGWIRQTRKYSSPWACTQLLERRYFINQIAQKMAGAPRQSLVGLSLHLKHLTKRPWGRSPSSGWATPRWRLFRTIVQVLSAGVFNRGVYNGLKKKWGNPC